MQQTLLRALKRDKCDGDEDDEGALAKPAIRSETFSPTRSFMFYKKQALSIDLVYEAKQLYKLLSHMDWIELLRTA